MRLYTLLFFIVFGLSSFSQNFEGKLKEIQPYNLEADTKQSFKSVWYVSAPDEFVTAQTKQLDTNNIAYYTEANDMISGKYDQYLLNKLGIPFGFYHGVYYAANTDMKKKRKTAIPTIDYYLAYLGIDLRKCNVHVNFVGINRQYVMKYDLNPKERSIAFFRMSSNVIDENREFKIVVTALRDKATIKVLYNLQELTLTLTPYERKRDAFLRKLGLNKKELVLLQDAPAKSLEELMNDKDQK